MCFIYTAEVNGDTNNGSTSKKNVLGWVPEQQKEKKRKKDLVLLGLRRDIMETFIAQYILK